MALKKTPFYSALVDCGAQMGERLGFDVPMAFESHEAEHRAVRTTGGIFDIFGQMVIEVTGPDAAAFLDSVVVADIRRLAVRRVVYCSILNPQGGMLDDLTVYHLSRDRYWVVPSIHRYGAVVAILNERLGSFAATVTALGFRYATLSVQGPKSRELLTTLTTADLGNGALPYFGVTEVEIADAPGVVLSRTGFTGELGYELFIPAEYCDHVYRRVVAAGQALGVVPCGLLAMGSLRIEKKLLVYGVDMDETISPIEAGLGWTVRPKETDYIGKEVVEEQKAGHVPRRVVALASSADHLIEPSSPIFIGDHTVGKVTSGASAFTLGQRVGIAVIAADDAIEGRVVTVRSSIGEFSATVHLCPLYDPANLRTRM